MAGERTQRECGFLLSRRTFPLQLQKGSRTKDGDSLIASHCLEILVASDEIICVSGECRCYHEVIFRMARHAVNCDSQRSQAGRSAKEDTRRSQVFRAETPLEVGFVECPFQLGEDMV